MEHDTGFPEFGRSPLDPARQPDVIGSEGASTGRARRTALVATGAALLVAAGGAAAWAASSSPSPSPSAAPAPSYGYAPPDGSGLQREYGGRLGRGFGGALHGELTVPDGSSAYKQVLVQRGTVTAVSPTSLTVKSADGYSRTYVLTKDTKINGKAGDTSSLKVDDTVGVRADLTGQVATATHVLEPGSFTPGDGVPGYGAPADGEHAWPGWHGRGPYGGFGPDETAPDGASPAPATPAPSQGEGSSAQAPAPSGSHNA